MRFNRNRAQRRNGTESKLADWDMRFNRNALVNMSQTPLKLADWDMRFNRNPSTEGEPLDLKASRLGYALQPKWRMHFLHTVTDGPNRRHPSAACPLLAEDIAPTLSDSSLVAPHTNPIRPPQLSGKKQTTALLGLRSQHSTHSRLGIGNPILRKPTVACAD